MIAMAQVNMFKDVPETSLKAFNDHKKSGRKKSQDQQVLGLIGQYPDRTSRELGALSKDLDAYQVARSISNLQKINAVKRSGKRCCTTNGNEMFTWKQIHTNIGIN